MCGRAAAATHRREALGGATVGVGPGTQQQLQRAQVAGLGGQVHGRPAVLVMRLHARTRLEQDLHCRMVQNQKLGSGLWWHGGAEEEQGAGEGCQNLPTRMISLQ